MTTRVEKTGRPLPATVSHQRPLILHIGNALYRRYLEARLSAGERPCRFVNRASLAEAISQTPNAVLILQSDEDEYGCIEIAARLKRLFLDNLRIIFLSADPRVFPHADGVADACRQFPVAIDRLIEVADEASDVNRRVLLIDDSRLVHRTIVDPLREAGFEVFQAYDGVEGVDAARKHEPRLIICDVEMPRLNGFDACARIRAAQGDRQHIIMLSTLGSAADQQRGFEAGVDEYVTKPVVISELIDRLERALRQSVASRENILILERDDTLSRNLVKALTRSGFRTLRETSIRAGVRTLSRVTCDLAVCETSLEDGSIIDLFNALRTLPAERRPDVLILASRENQAEMRMAMNAGAAGIISKPFAADKLLALLERSLADRRAKRERAQLQRYVSRASMRMALEKSVMAGDAATARADPRVATILFSDIVSFTSRCERYTPREVVEQVNTLFDVMTRVIMESGGDIDKFMGDACMAFWLDDGSGSSRRKAIDAVLNIRRAITAANATSPLFSADPIAIRVGLNTGDVILCDIGAIDARIDLTIISDAVNIASRLESATKQYGLDNLISEATIGGDLDRYSARLVDRVRVKGKDRPVGCYELFGLAAEAGSSERELTQKFNEAFALYVEGEFERAQKLFSACEPLEAANSDMTPSRLYIQRCLELMAEPPQNWDGVWTLNVK